MKNGPVIGLVIVSLLLWAATAPSATTWGETRLDDVLRALLGIKPKQVDPNQAVQDMKTGAGLTSIVPPVTLTTPTTKPITSNGSFFMIPDSSGGLFK